MNKKQKALGWVAIGFAVIGGMTGLSEGDSRAMLILWATTAIVYAGAFPLLKSR